MRLYPYALHDEAENTVLPAFEDIMPGDIVSLVVMHENDPQLVISSAVWVRGDLWTCTLMGARFGPTTGHRVYRSFVQWLERPEPREKKA